MIYLFGVPLLGKHQGMFTDNLNLGGSVGLRWEDALKELE